jgi:hypothetical protein
VPAALASPPARIDHRANLRSIIQRRGFRRLLAIRMISQVADGWFQAGLAGSVLFSPEKRASPAAIATAFAILLVPYSAIGPFAGVFLDRWRRRGVLVLANSARAAAVIPVALLIWLGRTGPVFVLLALACIAINRFVLAGLGAAQPHVVDAPRLVTANALATTAGTIMYATGLGTATLVFHLTGSADHPYALVAGAAALGYAASAVLARVSFTETGLGPEESGRPSEALTTALLRNAQGMVAGVRHLASRRGAAAVVLAQAGHRLLYGVLLLDAILLYRNYFNAGHNFAHSMTGLGSLVVAGAVGALAASVITPGVTRLIGGWRWVVLVLAVVAVAIPLLVLPYRSRLLVVAVFLVNLAAQSLKIVTDTALQLECTDEYRGRVFSCNDTMFNLSFVGGIVIGAYTLTERGHAPTTVIAVGAGYGLIAVWYAVAGGRYARRAGDDIQTAG